MRLHACNDCITFFVIVLYILRVLNECYHLYIIHFRTTAKIIKMGLMKLIYFDRRGRAEISRMLFKLSERDFTDYRMTMEEWKTFKPGMYLLLFSF